MATDAAPNVSDISAKLRYHLLMVKPLLTILHVLKKTMIGPGKN